MIEDINLSRIAVILLFVLAFTVVGWTAPIIYTANAPDDHFIEMHSFDVDDTHVNADTHNICLDRTVHKPSSADITVEMRLLRSDGAIVKESSFSVDAYYQKGRKTVIIPRKIRTESLQPGTYRYIETTRLSYHSGYATKKIVFTSNEFQVYQSKEELQASGDVDC